MLLRPALRTPSCNIHTISLRLSPPSQRTFANTSISLAARRFQTQRPCHHHASRTTAVALPGRKNPLLLTTLAAGSLGAFVVSRPVTHNDTSPSPASSADFSSSAYSHGRDAKIPLSKDGGRSINPKAVRQISMGSLMGLGLGVVVSAFSKMLVLIAGLGIVVVQFAARRGYNILPVDRMQRFVKGIDLRSAINDNAAFKISFGLMFALTAFGDL